MAELPIQIHEADLPPGVVVIASPVRPDEVLPGETVVEAMVRLRRAVVIHTTPAGIPPNPPDPTQR